MDFFAFLQEYILYIAFATFFFLNLYCAYIRPELLKGNYGLGFTLSVFGMFPKTNKYFITNLVLTGFLLFYFEYSLLEKNRVLFSDSSFYVAIILAAMALLCLYFVAFFVWGRYTFFHNTTFGLFVFASIVFCLLVSLLTKDYIGITLALASFVIPTAQFIYTKKMTWPQLTFIVIFFANLIILKGI